jgi:hypothetical protein
MNQLAANYTRFVELRELTIKTPNTDAELSGLTENIANTLITYAPDLIGCWMVVRGEYEPYLQAKAAQQRRIGHILAEQARLQQEQATKEEGAGKIVSLPQ